MNAQINLSLGNAAEVIQQLRQILGMMQGVNTGASMPTGPLAAGPMSGSTGLGQGTSGPPMPLTGAQQAGGAAMSAGTPMVGQAVASVQAKAAAASSGSAFAAASHWGSPTRGNNVPLGIDPNANRYVDLTTEARPGLGQGTGGPGVGGIGLGQMLGGAIVGHHLLGIGQAAAMGWGASMAEGRPFYAGQLAPSALQASWTAIGAALGSVVPGVGTLAGAAVGSIVGGVNAAIIEPLVRRGEAAHRLTEQMLGGALTSQRAAVQSGAAYLSTGGLNAAASLYGQGLRAPGSYMSIAGIAEEPYEGMILQTAMAGRTSPGMLMLFGMPRPDEPSSTFSASLNAQAWQSPAAAASFRAIEEGNRRRAREEYRRGNSAKGDAFLKAADGYMRRAAAAESAYATYQVNQDALEGAGARNSVEMGLAARYRSSGAVQEWVGLVDREADLIDAQAEAVSASHPGKAMAMRAGAKQKRYSAREAYFTTLTGEIEAYGGLASGDAQRAILSDTYSGKRFDQINFGAASTAASTHATALEAMMEQRRRVGMLGAAEEAMLTNQIRSLRFQAEVEIPRGAEQTRNSTLMGETGFKNASHMAANIGRYTYGSASEQAGVYDEQAKALKEQASTLQQILQTSRFLSHEQRIQLQTQVKQLEVETVRTERAGLSARASAEQATVNVRLSESTVAPSISLIQGAGGFSAYGAKASNLAASQGRMAAAQTRMQSLVAGGASYDDPEVQALREQIANMKIGLAQEEVGLADVPMSGQQREKLATLQGETALMRMGYGGTAGGIRGNLMRQIAVMGERAEDLSRTEAALKASGRWNDAMAARFAEQRSEVALRAAGLQSEYDEGFDQRLISRAYNMPSQGRLVMSGFTRRESAFSGVYNRLFGGTLEQTRRMRVDTPARLHAMLSSGNPIGMEDLAMRNRGGYVGNNGGPVQVEGKVTVTVQSDQGKVIGQSEAWVKQVDQFYQRFNKANDEGKAGGF